jgi:hypothetical protein
MKMSTMYRILGWWALTIPAGLGASALLTFILLKAAGL